MAKVLAIAAVVHAAAAAAAAAAATTQSSCCSLLSALQLSLSTLSPLSAGYRAFEASYWSAQEGSIAPACVVRPESSGDVGRIVAALNGKGCELAIRGGGHAPAAGFANVAGGVTLDMSFLNGTEASDGGEVARVGAGARWVDVYSSLEQMRRSVAGGRNGRVGVAGLTLGGGISYFSPQVGFACDGAVNFEVVLASGRVVEANESSMPDLFRALKGGTNNFGVVTRVDMRTLQLAPGSGPDILGGSVTYAAAQRSAVFRAFANIADSSAYDVRASMIMTLARDSTTGNWSVATTPIYTEPVEKPAFYDELFAIPNITSSVSLRKLSVFADEPPIPQLHFAFTTGTYAVSQAFLERMFDEVDEVLRSSTDDGGAAWAYTLEPLPTVITARGAGANSLGTSAAEGNAMVLLLSPAWTDGSRSAQVSATARRILTRVNAAASEMGMLLPFVYANYAAAEQDPLASYGAENLAFLRAVARKYDPSGFFQTSVPGGFKLDRSSGHESRSSS